MLLALAKSKTLAKVCHYGFHRNMKDYRLTGELYVFISLWRMDPPGAIERAPNMCTSGSKLLDEMAVDVF